MEAPIAIFLTVQVAALLPRRAALIFVACLLYARSLFGAMLVQWPPTTLLRTCGLLSGSFPTRRRAAFFDGRVEHDDPSMHTQAQF